MKDLQLTQRQLTTAVYEYLEKRGKIPNRRKGVEFQESFDGIVSGFVQLKKPQPIVYGKRKKPPRLK